MTAAAAVILLIAADLITKHAAEALRGAPKVLIPGVFELRYFENHGAAFSMLQGQFVFFYISTAAVIAAILYVFIRMPAAKRYRLLAFDLCLLFSGAVGNLFDRISFHYVRDFLYFSLIDFPIFNVADICVTCGAILLAFLLLLYYKDGEFSFLSRGGKKHAQDSDH